MLHLCVPIAAGTAAGVLPLARKSASIGRLVLRCAHCPAVDACRALVFATAQCERQD
jgi:hypothetical protein